MAFVRQLLQRIIKIKIVKWGFVHQIFISNVITKKIPIEINI